MQKKHQARQVGRNKWKRRTVLSFTQEEITVIALSMFVILAIAAGVVACI